MRTCVRALEQPGDRDRAARPPARVSRRGGRAPFRRTRGDRDEVLRGSGQVDPEPRTSGVPDAVPVDDQPVPRLRSRLPLLQRWRDADPDGRRTPQADLRARSRRRDLRDQRRGLWLSALRPHHRPRQVDHGQAGLPAHARVWDRADSERRSPVAEQSRVEARRAQRARPARPAVSDDPQPPGGDGTGSAAAGARRRLPPWIPVRNHPRRRFAAGIRLPSHGWLARHRLSLPACALGPRGAPPGAGVPGVGRDLDQRAGVPSCRGRAARDDRDLRPSGLVVRTDQSARRVAGTSEPTVVSRVPRWDLRRRGIPQRLCAEDRQHRFGDPRVGGGVLAPPRVRRGARPHELGQRAQVRPRSWWSVRASSLLPPHRPGDHAKAELRRPDGQDVRGSQGGRDRAAEPRAAAL